MTAIIRSVDEWRRVRAGLSNQCTVGFVPTMGALHEGHISLVQRSKHDNDITVVSIFVNPTQFNDKKDLDRYPRNDERDFSILRESQIDYVFFPSYHDLYPDDFAFNVSENVISQLLEGVSRPGHFDGVLTVVMKLLNIIRPHRSYFGEKDYQQYSLIRKMCEAFFMDIDIILCPTIRDQDGLALSSRNALLTAEARAKAPEFYRLLSSANTPEQIAAELIKNGFTVDYLTDYEGRRFGAVFLDGVRLIDNVSLTNQT
jgi:pantoate--beta-alanine ligase